MAFCDNAISLFDDCDKMEVEDVVELVTQFRGQKQTTVKATVGSTDGRKKHTSSVERKDTKIYDMTIFFLFFFIYCLSFYNMLSI